MKVLLADENRAFRAFIRQILEVERDVRVKVVGEAADAEWLPETKVIMLSVVDGETYRRAATKHGADAFLPKSAPVSEILLSSGRRLGKGCTEKSLMLQVFANASIRESLGKAAIPHQVFLGLYLKSAPDEYLLGLLDVSFGPLPIAVCVVLLYLDLPLS